ncbi:MAG TPA: MauE/DoxX family redox-associated membrane protein, partial [Mucilaginibacter sp.]
MSRLKKISLIVLIVFYVVAGINHFRDQESYIKIIPHYFPHPEILNLIAGFFEFLFALLLIFYKTREVAAWGIIFMLIAFLPVHTNMIREAPIHMGDITVTPLIAWVRLIILQPFLIFWA